MRSGGVVQDTRVEVGKRAFRALCSYEPSARSLLQLPTRPFNRMPTSFGRLGKRPKMFSLGVVGLYVGQVFRNVQRRPYYIVADTIGSAEAAHD